MYIRCVIFFDLKVFKPDKTNGFEVQSEGNARAEAAKYKPKKISAKARWVILCCMHSWTIVNLFIQCSGTYVHITDVYMRTHVPLLLCILCFYVRSYVHVKLVHTSVYTCIHMCTIFFVRMRTLQYRNHSSACVRLFAYHIFLLHLHICTYMHRAHDNFLDVSGHHVLTNSRMPRHSHTVEPR